MSFSIAYVAAAAVGDEMTVVEAKVAGGTVTETETAGESAEDDA